MATKNLIQIKRSETTATPSSLSDGELAYSSNGNILYIGDFGSVIAIAGERNPGTLTANQALVANSTSGIDSLITDSFTLNSYAVNSIIDDDTFATGVANTSLASSASIKAYVDSQVGAVVSSFTISDGVASDTVNTGETLTFSGANGITTAVTNNQVQIDAVAANSTISVTATGIAVNEGNLSLNASQISDLGTNAVTSLTGTTNEVEVSASTGAVTIGLPNDVTVANTLTVGGDLIVNGTTTTLNTTQLNVEDNLIVLASNNSTDVIDFGFYGQYNDGTEKFSGLIRDASDAGTYKLLEGITVEPTGNTFTGGTLAALDVGALAAASITLTTALTVPNGGTGATSFTTNGILYGNSTSALQVTAAGTYGQVLQADVSGVPVFGTLDGGTF